ncbi:MAG: BrnT family toxin [Deltaproteobacteria bacterium]|nr:BrnT family toxin [Deltaproteobacteria bacterium]MBW2100598.1 BrnT family toxin [Deltaproteobacteria bacterium]
METEWDQNKSRLNFLKHSVLFSDAESVLYDPYALTLEDESAEGEQRHITIGMDSLGRILVVVFTYRGEKIRLISARRATKKERKAYEAGI